jgi:hypothetical protein
VTANAAAADGARPRQSGARPIVLFTHGPTQRGPSRVEAERDPEDEVRRQRHDDEARRQVNPEEGRVRREEHGQLEEHGQRDGPPPAPPARVADHGHVHHAERDAVGEVIRPSDEVRREHELRVGLLRGERLAEEHGAEAREDLEQRQAEPRRTDAVDRAD